MIAKGTYQEIYQISMINYNSNEVDDYLSFSAH